MSNLNDLLELIPDYAKDIKLNMAGILTHGDNYLNEQQVAGILYVSALATKHAALIKAATQHVTDKLDEQYMRTVKAAATIMAMNNIYYRFTHLVSDHEYMKLPARLRMNVMANPGISKIDFELYTMAVSIINGCGKCMDTHAKSLEQHGLAKEGVQACARIAAVVFAFSQVLVIEELN